MISMSVVMTIQTRGRMSDWLPMPKQKDCRSVKGRQSFAMVLLFRGFFRLLFGLRAFSPEYQQQNHAGGDQAETDELGDAKRIGD